MKSLCNLTCVLVLGLVSIASAQVQINPIQPTIVFNGGNGMRPNGEPDLASVLLSQHHRDQLELDPKQQAQVLAAIRKAGEGNFALTQISINGGNVAELQNALNVASNELAFEIESYLYPEQIVAAKQIGVSEYIRATGLDKFAETQVAGELNMTPSQIKSLQEKASKIELNLRKKIAELQKQARADLVNAFPVDKRQKLLDIFKLNGSHLQGKKNIPVGNK